MKTLYLLAAVLCLALAACGPTKPDANYQAYVEAQKAQTTLESSRIDSLTLAATACNGDARCVENVVAFASLVAAGVAKAAGGNIQPFVERPSFWSQAGLALVGQIAPLASAGVNAYQAKMQRDTSVAQFNYLDHVLSTAVSGMATTASNAQPNINVGGNYGDTHTGDTIGGSQVGHDYVPGTQTNNSGNIGNDNRQSSPGPIGPACTGDTCQSTNPPAPTPSPAG
jgi:hypothetical protein